MARIERWATVHRHVPFQAALRRLKRLLGWRWGHWLGYDLLLGLERRINRLWVPSPPRAFAPRGPMRTGR
jgi:hypothetical protein